MSANVERIFHAIQDLTDRERASLFGLLERSYHWILPDDRRKLQRPWDDPRNEFGFLQTRLLRFLDGKGAVENRKAIEHLWGQELDHYRPPTQEEQEQFAKLLEKLPITERLGLLGKPKTAKAAARANQKSARMIKRVYAALRDRLRQLKSSTNKRFLKLHFPWRIARPRNNQLELRI